MAAIAFTPIPPATRLLRLGSCFGHHASCAVRRAGRTGMMPGMAGTLAGLDHALLDVGEGRRLERFGSIIVDRPWPPVEGSSRADPAAWRAAESRFDMIADGAGGDGGWSSRGGRAPGPGTY